MNKKQRQRKHLDRTPEEFFELVLLAIGPIPWQELETFMHYIPRHGMSFGPSAYLYYSPTGRQFIELLMQCGEAKARAWKWFKAYNKWVRDKRKEQNHAVHDVRRDMPV